MHYLIALLMLLACACGGEIDQPTTDVAPPSSATIVVRHNLARAVSQEVTRYRFAGLDDAGRLVFGPEDRPKSSEVRLGVPLTVRQLNIEYLSDTGKVGVFRTPVTLTAGQDSVIEDPAWSGGGLHIVPQNFWILENSSGQVQALDSNQNPVAAGWAAFPNIVLEADNVIQALGPAMGTIYAEFENDLTTTSYKIVPPEEVTSLSLPSTTQVGVGPSMVTLVPSTFGFPVLGGAWSTSDPSIAIVDSLGRVTGISPGSATLTVTINGYSATTQVTVESDPFVLTLDLYPHNPTAQNFGSDLTFFVNGRFSDGSVRDMTNFCDYTSSDSTILDMNGFNQGSPLNSGQCTVTATYFDLSSSTTVTVE